MRLERRACNVNMRCSLELTQSDQFKESTVNYRSMTKGSLPPYVLMRVSDPRYNREINTERTLPELL